MTTSTESTSTESGPPEKEGVIKYALDFSPAEPLESALLPALNAWRALCRLTGLIGQDPDRYDGYGFGNISARLEAGKPAFLITGSQTGHISELTAAEYAVVERCFATENRVVAHGPLQPSAESLTHGAVYDSDTAVNAVIHAHSPEIWHHAARLRLPQTADVAYGSPEMAAEVARLFSEGEVTGRKLFTMRGHEDGVVAFGGSLDEAGVVLLQALASALKISYS